jgi:hypothetical protein
MRIRIGNPYTGQTKIVTKIGKKIKGMTRPGLGTACIGSGGGQIKVIVFRIRILKEVLRREIQGLKVWPVYRSQVFSITGTYF